MWTSDDIKKVTESNDEMSEQLDQMDSLIDALDEAQVKQRAIKAKSDIIKKKIKELNSI